jgi:hypothetical protein
VQKPGGAHAPVRVDREEPRLLLYLIPDVDLRDPAERQHQRGAREPAVNGGAHSYYRPYAAFSFSKYYIVTLTPLGVARLYSWSGAAAMLASARPVRMGVWGMAKWLPMVVSLESMAGDATGL